MTMHISERDISRAAVITAATHAPQTMFPSPSETGIYGRHLKRAFDAVAVLISLPFILPIVALFAILIRRDGGPAFYCQDRVGRDGKIFRFWKLRSMVPDAEAHLVDYLSAHPEARAEWDATQKLKSDPRITRVGRFIRKTSLDELPQLWNVLRGDMSLVGPRPMLPEQRALYPGRAYFDLRPGITGFWQIGDRNNTTFSARAVHDTKYASSLSFTTDLAVLLLTARTVMRCTGY